METLFRSIKFVRPYTAPKPVSTATTVNAKLSLPFLIALKRGPRRLLEIPSAKDRDGDDQQDGHVNECIRRTTAEHCGRRKHPVCSFSSKAEMSEVWQHVIEHT